MKVTSLPDAGRRRDGPRRVAIGTFDGVHLGHRAVIGDSDTVLTFEPHPMAVLQPERAPKLLCSFAVKRDLIANLGVEELVVIPFDREFASRPPENFVSDVLISRLGAGRVSVGENFRFGKGVEGDPSYLLRHSEFETRVVALVEAGGETVSSSHIRTLIGAGEMARAAELLAQPFVFEGEVVGGDRRGRELGMPTANIIPDDRMVFPGRGVYAACVRGQPAAVNVGVRPTFDSDRGVLIEAHLIDWAGDLYGQTLRIEFLDRLRGEERFDSVDALVAQMRLDVDQAREIASATVPRR
ncbi:MAG: bifunctional riboflavin kinase/FAD synthetase [Thermoleophilaceae bacterium]